MRLLDVDFGSERYEAESRSYLLVIGKKWVKEGPLFFSGYFLPLTKKLVSARKNQDSEIRQKKITVLLEQVWDLFPNYCESVKDFEAASVKLMPTIKLKLSQSNNSIIRSIAVGFTKLVNSLLEAKSIPLDKKTAYIELLGDIAGEYLKKFTEIYMSYPKEKLERKEILQAIGAFSLCLKSSFLNSIYESECLLLLNKADAEMKGEEVSELCKKIDILSVLARGLALTPENVGLIQRLVSEYIDHYEYSIQKKMYLIILTLIKKSGADNLADAIGIYRWIERSRQPVAKVGRARVVAAIVEMLSKQQGRAQLELGAEVETLVNSLLPELIALISSAHRKTRDEALAAAAALSRLVSDKGGLVPFFKKLLGGLAGRSEDFRTSTLVLLGRLLYEHNAELPPEFVVELTNVVVLLLKDQDKRIVRETMNYVKVLVSVLPKEKLEGCTDLLANGLLVWTGKFKQQLRIKIRYIFAKLIKKTSAEFVKAKVMDVDKNLVDYICKMMRREKNLKKRKKQENKGEKKKDGSKKKYEDIIKEEEKESEDENMESENAEAESILSDTSSDIPEEDVPVISNEKEEKNETGELLEDRIEKMMNAPENELDTHFFKGPKAKRQKEIREDVKEAREDMELYIAKESGKLIVKDENAKPKKRKAAEPARSAKAKRVLPENSESEDEPEPRKKKVLEKKGKAVAVAEKAKKTEGHFEVHTGEEYKGKAGKSDAWKKGQKFEPYAYVRFNPKVCFGATE